MGNRFKELRPAFARHDAAYQTGGWDWGAPSKPSAICQAASNGDTEKVKQLLSEGADPNEQRYHGWTPLMIAVANGQVETAKLLLSSGADPNTINLLGRTALMFASKYGNEELVQALLKWRADPNLCERYTTEPNALGAAALEGHQSIVELLLSAGADPAFQGPEGKVPYQLAQEAGHGEIAAILRKAFREMKDK